ncbi:DUF2490 domain-containing protein [Flavobacteriaceae bacterium XHP0103]|uniref:DUF2490 domain-containing protein n=1 Tax=Marixanthotalea marina TaxID=2844359 RepID=UPI00298A063C|nr:DUF2490 domain-containing protein [Marixanthotalea marina]MBU3821557.1 DUF2490 domain-containing protein [Marixanthotalea marina]
MKALLLVIALVYGLFGYSQTSPESKLGTWYMYDGTHKIAEKFSLKTGIQLRTYEVFDNMNLWFFYGGGNYHLNKKTTFTLAYCYLDIDRSFAITELPHAYENRFYEQVGYNQSIFNLPISHRFRLEHRILNYKHNTDFQNRIRYRLGTKINLNKTLFVSLNNEFFFNFKGDLSNENRLCANLGLNINKNSIIQFGYLNHKINGLNLHRLQVGIYLKTDHTKKKN